MFYLVQTNIFKEENYDMLTHHMERMGLEYEIVRVIPFIGEMEFTTERRDAWCFGAVKMAHITSQYGFYPGSMYNDNHDHEVYGPYYGENMLNAEGIVMKFSDPLPEDEKWTMFFARPTKDTKIFSGQIFMRHSWDEYVEQCKQSDSVNIIEDETHILISPLKNIHQEIRCWVVNKKVITMSQYKLGTRVTYKNMDHDEEALQFAQSMVNLYQPADAFVIDICRTDEGMKVVEVNCINCAGFYDMNMPKLLNALEEFFNPLILENAIIR